MQRRRFIALVSSATLGILARPARAQRRPGTPRVVFFSPGVASDFRTESFRRGLADQGYVEGQNLKVEYVFTTPRDMARHAMEIAQRGPDAIVAATTPVALAAKRATTTIPIIAVSISDPVGTGLVDSLARPGHNVTSLSNQAADIAGKRLEILKEVVPGLAGVGVLVNPDDPASMVQLAQFQAAARTLGLETQVAEARKVDDFEQAFSAMRAGKVQAAAITQVFLFVNNAPRLATIAIRSRLPAMFSSRDDVEGSGLISYGTSIRAVFHRTAHLLDKVLNGVQPADIPVEQPTRFEVLVNLKSAKALGLSIPESFLLRADAVIE